MEISKLHYISQELEGKSHAVLIEEACNAGADWVQLRMKNKSWEEALKIAQEAKTICTHYNARLIINDHVIIARDIKADGVHLGKTDMEPAKAREILGDGFIIGGTANTIEDIRALQNAKVNYIGLGPFRFTTTKANLSPILGLEGYRQLLAQCKKDQNGIPVIAIGGILVEDLESLMTTGIHGVAISSLINKARNKTEVITSLKKELN